MQLENLNNNPTDLSTFTARVMADVFIEQREGGDLTDKGYAILHDLFGDVTPDERADTYLVFLQELSDRGFDYDLAEIQKVN